MKRLTVVIIGLIFFFCTSATAAEKATRVEYPTKPVRIVVGFSAGGPVDTLARLLAPKLSESFGQRFIIDNRPGASGMIGAELTAKAPPDGYTLLVVPATHTVNPSLHSKMPFDTVRDFTAIGTIAEGPMLLVVHPSLPVKSVKDLIALAKSKHGQLNYATAGIAGPPHLAGELFKNMADLQMEPVHYKGAAPATIELVGGHVPIMFNNMISAVPHVKAGRLRAIAVTTSKRSSALTDIPTVAESGLEGYDVSTWWGFLAPAGLPPDVLSRLNKAINQAVLQPDVVKQLANQGVEPITSTPDEFAARIRREIAKWAVVVKASGATAN